MRALLYFGGPLIVAIGFGFYSGLLEFAHNLDDGESGGTYAIEHQETYQCDENGNNCVLVDEKTEVKEVEDGELPPGVSASANYRLEEQQTGFSDISGLELEVEQEPIEYREGDEPTTVRKLNGLSKYTNIVMRRPTGFDWKTLRFEFERQVKINKINKEYDEKIKEAQAEAE